MPTTSAGNTIAVKKTSLVGGVVVLPETIIQNMSYPPPITPSARQIDNINRIEFLFSAHSKPRTVTDHAAIRPNNGMKETDVILKNKITSVKECEDDTPNGKIMNTKYNSVGPRKTVTGSKKTDSIMEMILFLLIFRF